jgi:uncharacterized membrane protein YgaE (UPF0421/DUF939 family)|nr:hypothetical protein [[Pseudomonas] sp. BICA1-14]
MKTIKTGVAVMLALGISLAAHAQEAEPVIVEDDTMVVVDDETEVEDVVNQIELPATASPEGVENSAFGLDTANQAREQGREFGQQQANEARNRGLDARENAREAARESARESARSDARSDQRGAPNDIPRP